MIDIHTHILPGVDDGAVDIYDSIDMAALAYESGTKVIVATPHCNIPGVYSNYFSKQYCETFQRTKEILKREVPGITLLAGMEVFTTEALPRLLTDGKIFPINRTRYILMEFDFGENPDFADGMSLSRMILRLHISGRKKAMRSRSTRAAFSENSESMRGRRHLSC